MKKDLKNSSRLLRNKKMPYSVVKKNQELARFIKEVPDELDTENIREEGRR